MILSSGRRVPACDGTLEVAAAAGSGPTQPEFSWRRMTIAAARDGQWKLIRVRDDGNALDGLSPDLGEKHDLAKSHPQEMTQFLKQHESLESHMSKPSWSECMK